MKHVPLKRRALLAVLVLAALVIAVTVFAETGDGESNPFMNSFWALVPPIVAIALRSSPKRFIPRCSSAFWSAPASMQSSTLKA